MYGRGQQSYNQSMGYQSQGQMTPCTNCFKSFNPKALIQHELMCKPVTMSAKGIGKASNGFGLSQQKNIFDKNYGNDFTGGRSQGYSTNEKTIPCGSCFNKIPASQYQRHEMECRQTSMAKKGGNRVVGGGGSMKRTAVSSTRITKKEPEYEPPKIIQRPISLMCYICGREYGTKSLPIHLKTCSEKWDNEQSGKSYKDRRPMPRAPPGFDQLLAKDTITRKDIDNYNNRAFDQYNYDVLVPCQNCGRTFKPESLIPHQKSCKSGNPLKPMSNAQKEYQAEQMYAMQNGNQDLVPCSKCGRKFASDRVNKHQSVCKPGPTKQAVRKQKALELKKQKLDRNDHRYEAAGKKNNWRQQHEDFQNSLKYNRQVGAVEKRGGDIRSIKPPPASKSMHNMKNCPHCGRNFSDEAAARHIPACKNTINKPKSLVAKSHQYGGAQKPSQQSYGGYGGSLNSIGGGANKRAQSYNRPSYDNFDDDYDDDPFGGGSSKYTSPLTKYGGSNQKTYKITNSNYNSVNSSKGQFSTKGIGDRDSWLKQMGTKQQKTHDNLYGIGAFSGNQVSNGAAFPIPQQYRGGFR